MRVDFKYWNHRCLMKLVEHVGKFVRVDQVTTKREKFAFALVMVEVKIDPD